MMVSNQHADAEPLGGANALTARDTIVDRDDQVGHLRRGDLYDLGRQTIAKFKAIRDEVGHVVETHLPEQRYGQRATGGAIGIEVANNQDTALRLHEIGE